MLYDNKRYQEAYEVWITIPDARETLDRSWDEFIGLMVDGDFDAFPDSVKATMNPETLIHLGENDRAARRLSKPRGGDWIGNMYRVWSPIFDSIRQHPAMQEYMRAHGLAGATPQRTPVDERELPAVLRDASAEAGS
jgi:hypothetical protein